MSIKPAPKKAKCLKPFSHIFKNDVKQKYEFIKIAARNYK